jgi:RNA-binding protein YhbY
MFSYKRFEMMNHQAHIFAGDRKAKTPIKNEILSQLTAKRLIKVRASARTQY